jgi:hypothetical protein
MEECISSLSKKEEGGEQAHSFLKNSHSSFAFAAFIAGRLARARGERGETLIRISGARPSFWHTVGRFHNKRGGS